MTELQQIVLSRALSMLRGAGCKYIVIDLNGAEHAHGGLKLALPEPEPKRRTRKFIVPLGTYKKVYAPYVQDLQVGQTVLIPYNGLDPEGLQSACSAWCSKHWGNGSSMSHQTFDGLELMRLL